MQSCDRFRRIVHFRAFLPFLFDPHRWMYMPHHTSPHPPVYVIFPVWFYLLVFRTYVYYKNLRSIFQVEIFVFYIRKRLPASAGIYPLFHRTLVFCFSRSGTRLTAYRSSPRTDVKKGLFHKDIYRALAGSLFLSL